MLPSDYIYQERLRATPMVQLGSSVDEQGNPIPPDSPPPGAQASAALSLSGTGVWLSLGTLAAGAAAGALVAWLAMKPKRRRRR